MAKTVLLGDIAEVINGESFSSSDFVKTNADSLPVFKMGNILPGGGIRKNKEDYIPTSKIKNERSVTRPGDILMCMTDMKSSMNLLGYSAQISNQKFAVNQRVGIIRPRANKVNAKFLYYYLLSPDFINRLRTTAHSGVQVNLSIEEIKRSIINLPKVNEQKFVAVLLYSIDQKIALNSRMNETLEKIGQTLFKHYFIDNPDRKNWEDTKLENLCDTVGSGGTPSTKRTYFYDGEIDWYSTKELWDGFLLGSLNRITKQGLENSAAKLFPPNTVLIAIYAAPTVGRLGILTKESSFNQAACGLLAKSEIGYEYIYLLLMSQRKELNDLANGAAQQNISVGAIRGLPTILPPKGILEKFRRSISPIFKKVENNTIEIQRLTQLRDSLLPRLISGRL